MRRSITTDSTYFGYPIMTDPKHGLAADKKILQALDNHFNYANESKSKIYFLRLDVRFPAGQYEHTDNTKFSRFQSTFMQNLQRKGLKPQYVAVREQSKEKHQHYHVCLWLDGNKTKNDYSHIQTAERLWEQQLGLEPGQGQGLIDGCTKSRTGELMRNGTMLRVDDPDYEDKLDHCFYRASYLAKINTKGTPQGQRELFASRIPKSDREQR